MVKNVKFFMQQKQADYFKQATRNSQPLLTRNDKMKMYEVMMLKAFKKGVKLCHFGEMGDRFFIILEGQVGVRVPNWHEKSYNCVWDVLQYIIQEYDNIM